MAKKESYAVIGIGQFGASICESWFVPVRRSWRLISMKM